MCDNSDNLNQNNKTPNLDALKASMYQIAVEYQQKVYEAHKLLNDNNWTFKNEEPIKLKNYIGLTLFGLPQDLDKMNEEELYIYEQKHAMITIEKIYEQIYLNGKQLSDSTIYCIVIYCFIYDETSLLPDNDLQNQIQKVPIFKVQKNIKKGNKILFEDCYIDSEARVYKSWQDFLKNNTLKRYTIIAPKDGKYQTNLRELWSKNESSVWIQKIEVNTTSQLMNKLDNFIRAGSLIGAVAGSLPMATTLVPVGLGATAIAIGTGVGSGIWLSGRAVAELRDRSKHKQKIFSKNQAYLWIDFISSVIGIAAASGATLITRAVRTGATINSGARMTNNVIQIGNLAVNNSGLFLNVHSMYENYSENKKLPSPTEAILTTTQIFFMANSIANLKFTSTMIKESQTKYILDFENSLRSNRHKKGFKELIYNTEKLNSNKIETNASIIRSINKIDDKNELFAKIVQNRKLFASTKTKLSFADGQIKINQVSLVNPNEFATMSKVSIAKLINEPSIKAINCNIQMNNTNSSNNGLNVLNICTPENFVKENQSFCKNYIANMKPNDIVNIVNKTWYIYKELKNVPQNEDIFLRILDSGLVIAKGVFGEDVEQRVIVKAVDFVWEYIKKVLEEMGLSINSNVEKRLKGFMLEITLKVYKNIKKNRDEYVKLFKKYLNDFKNSEDSAAAEACSESEKLALKNVCIFEENVKFYDLVLRDPCEIMGLDSFLLTSLITHAVKSTNSNFQKAPKLKSEIINIYKKELEEFFLNYNITIKPRISNLGDKLKSVLSDLNNFEKKDIIIYKLIVINFQISKTICKDSDLDEKFFQKLFIDLFKFIWINVLLNFDELAPGEDITNKASENLIISIIIAIYNYVHQDNDAWKFAFCNFYEPRF